MLKLYIIIVCNCRWMFCRIPFMLRMELATPYIFSVSSPFLWVELWFLYILFLHRRSQFFFKLLLYRTVRVFFSISIQFENTFLFIFSSKNVYFWKCGELNPYLVATLSQCFSLPPWSLLTLRGVHSERGETPNHEQSHLCLRKLRFIESNISCEWVGIQKHSIPTMQFIH